jgi:hypothetical protein
MTDAAFDALIDATFGKIEANATKRGRETERRRRSGCTGCSPTPRRRPASATPWAYQSVAEYVDHTPRPHQGRRHAARATRVLTSDDPTGSSAAPDRAPRLTVAARWRVETPSPPPAQPGGP